MDIELARLQEMHPRLSADQALFLVAQAARGLERNGHATGVAIALELELVTHAGSLAWPAADLALDPHDHHRITEDGAEAVALALAHLQQRVESGSPHATRGARGLAPRTAGRWSR